MPTLKRKIGDTEVEYSVSQNDDEGWEPVPSPVENTNQWEPVPSEPAERGIIGKSWDFINTPITHHLPEQGRDIARRIMTPTGIPEKVVGKALGLNDQAVEGVIEGEANLAESMLSPLSLATAGTAGLISRVPLAARTLLSLGFTGVSGHGAYQSAREFIGTEDPKVKGRSLVEGIGNALFTGLGALGSGHAVKEVLNKRPTITGEPPIINDYIEANRPKISSDEFYQSEINEPLPTPFLSQNEKGKYLVDNRQVDAIIKEKYPQLETSSQRVKRQFLIDRQELNPDTPQFNKFEEGLESARVEEELSTRPKLEARPSASEISGQPIVFDPLENTIRQPQPLKSQSEVVGDKLNVDSMKKPDVEILDKAPELGSGELYSGLSAIPEAMKHVVNTYKDLKDNFGDFVPSTLKEIASGKPFGITADKEGKVNPFSLKAKMMVRLSKPEQEMLNSVGFDKFLESKGNTKVSLNEAMEYLKENAPRVEVRKLEVQESPYANESNLYNLRHELENYGFEVSAHNGRTNIRLGEEGEYASLDSIINNADLWSHKPGVVELAKKLKTEEERIRNTKIEPNESATQRYTMVNPKPLDKMEGAVDLLVRLPGNSLMGAAKVENKLSKNQQGSVTKFTSQHYPTEGKNLIAHVRGNMETLPDGRKVFHIFEVQSDWAQAVREMKEKSPNRIEGSTDDRAIKRLDDPTLPYYEHLALKSAIKHAIDNGADAIAISDANTAMLSEGHDSFPRNYLPASEHNKKIAANLISKMGENVFSSPDSFVINRQNLNLIAQGNEHPLTDAPSSLKQWKKLGFDIQQKIDQEKGMRLHYDNSLPNIARKLTGNEPEKVSFGEHQNTINRSTDPDSRGLGSPLIIKNASGEFQTTIEANLFNLDKLKPKVESGEPFSIYGATYANPLGPILKTAGKVAGEVAQKLFSYDPTRPQVDKVAEKGPTGKYVAPLLGKFYEEFNNYRGKLVNKLEKALLGDLNWKQRNLTLDQSSPEMKNALKYLNDMNDNGTTSVRLNAKEQKIVNAIRQNLLDSAAIQHVKNIPVWTSKGPRPKIIDPNYFPHDLSNNIIKILQDKQGTPEFIKTKQQFLDWHTKRGMTLPEAQSAFRDIVESFKPTDESNKGSQFGPVDKAAGVGIPPEWRNNNLLSIMHSFNTRLARRFAYFDTIESNPLMREALGIKSDVWGKPTPKNQTLPTGQTVDYLGGSSEVAPILRDIEAKRSIKDLNIDAGTTFIKTQAMQFLSGLRDLTASNVLGWRYQLPTQYAASIVRGIANTSRGIAEGIEKGIIRPDMIAMESVEGGIGDVVTGLQKLTTLSGKLSGRNVLEKIARGGAFEQGKYLAINNVLALSKGSTNKQRLNFMDKFAQDISWKGRATLTPEEIATIASRYVTATQGSYDYRGLPRATQEGAASPFLNWSRWNIEQKNRFIKDVVIPMKEGNYWPLLGATASMLVGGEALEKLNEMFNAGKKPKAPSFSEIKEAPERSGEALFYKLASLADAAGSAGFLATVVHNIMKVRFGDNPQALFDFPLAESIAKAGRRLMQAIEAFENGESDVGINFVNQFLQDNIQNYRLLLNFLMTEKKENAAYSNKQRDLKMFKELSGQHEISTYGYEEKNPFVGKEAKEFKRASKSDDVGPLFDKALGRALENKNPTKAARAIEGLRSNPITWMPSMKNDPQNFMEYLSFIRSTQGEQAADKLVREYMNQLELNEAKRDMVPRVR